MNELTQKIKQWSFDRNLQTAKPIKQYDKLIEEFGELVQGLNKDNKDLIKDSIGDMYVVLVVMFTQLEEELPIKREAHFETSTVDYMSLLAEIGRGLESGNMLIVRLAVANLLQIMELTCIDHFTNLEECVQIAYEEIKDRKGKMIDGKFVKESDLKETPESKLQSKNKETRHPNKYMD